jgi:gluconolactonase
MKYQSFTAALLLTILTATLTAQNIGVGAKPVKGAKLYMDGTAKTLNANWTYWKSPRLAATLPIKWAVVPDPTGSGTTAISSNDPAAAGGIYGAADIVTKDEFRDFRAHVEFCIANPGGNSGVYLQNRFEIQVLDADSTIHGLASVINERRSPYHVYNGMGKWNAYDIVFRAARFREGKMVEKPMVTLHFNGIKVHRNQTINQVWGGPNSGIDGGNDGGKGITDVPGGLKLQGEGHDVLYRNIWIQRLELPEANTDLIAPAQRVVDAGPIQAKLLRQSFKSALDGSERDYFIYLPKDYDEYARERYPVLMFLHGNGERGNGKDELDFTMIHGPLYEAWIQKRDLPFIIIVPQLPMFDLDKAGIAYLTNRPRSIIPERLEAGIPPRRSTAKMSGPMAGALPSDDFPGGIKTLPKGWDFIEADLLAMLDHAQTKLKGDPERTYLTGLSYGGFGTWHLAGTHPERFAAIAPVVGWGHPDYMTSIARAGVPSWTFAGGFDNVVEAKYFYPGINKLKALGGTDVRFTTHEDLGHDTWIRVYGGQDLYDWFLSHTKKANAPPPVPEAPKTIGSVVSADPSFATLINPNAKIEVLADGFRWSEGPVWVKSGGYLLFSDVPANIVFKWKDGEGLSEFLKPSGYTGPLSMVKDHEGSNGLILNRDGKLVLCEHGDRRLSTMSLETGSKITLTDRHEGRRYNSPNDVAQHSNGDYYFTDPPYGLKKGDEDPAREMSVNGVYRVNKDGKTTLLVSNLTRPNGIAFSPDEKVLYVGQSDPQKPYIMAYNVRPDGTLDTGTVLYDATALSKSGLKGMPDGLRVDQKGNIFATGPGGVLVLSPKGILLGRIDPGVATANCTWGDDGSTLYMTSHNYLCRIKTLTKGE